MRRFISLWVCAAFVLGIVAFTQGSGTAGADDGTDATIAAQQTKIAKLQTSVAKRDVKIDELQTKVADLRATEAEPAATTAPEKANAAGSESATLGGNALGLLPPGEANKLDVVLVGPYDGNLLPIVVRNNTDKDLKRLSVTATARTADGQLIAAGGDQGLNPYVVTAGSYSVGYIYFDGIALPADASFEFEVNGEASAGIDSFDKVDLTVKDASFLGDRIVGEFVNGSDVTVSGPISIAVVCVAGNGSLISFDQGFSDKDKAAPGETVPFQVSFYDGVDCTNFLVAGGGYSF